MKLSNDDYRNVEDPQAALADFQKRVSAYVEQYEPLEDAEVVDRSSSLGDDEVDPVCGLVRIVNGGQKLQCCNLGSSMVMLNITMLLSCFHLTPRRLFLVKED